MIPEVRITIKTEDDEEVLDIYLLDTGATVKSLPPVSDLVDAIEEILISEFFLYDVLSTKRS